MAQQVELSVRSQLNKVVEDLQHISQSFKEVGENSKKTAEDVGDSINSQVKKTEGFMNQLRSLGGRVANQLRGDFKALISLNALSGALKLSNQFGGAIKETITLSDTIRKLGTTFGIAQSGFAQFQSFMTRGLGEIGLSGETAANAMQGLSHTQVRGQNNILEYSKMAGELGVVSGQKGQEGEIARGIADVIRARGGNVNDPHQATQVAETIRKIFNATGQSPTETLKSMENMFQNMSSDLRNKLGPGAMTSLATAGAVAGPDATKFLEEYLSKSPIQRMAMDAQGMKGVIGPNGLDINKFASVSKNILGRIGGDPRMAAQTLGVSEEAAEGFVRLSQSLNQVKTAQDTVNKSTGDLNSQYRNSMGLVESFRANMNHVMGLLGKTGVLGNVTQGVTGFLSKNSQSDAGSLGVVAGGGLLAALLAGVGMRGVGGILGGVATSAAKGAATTALTGKEVQPVYVVNAAEIAAGGAAAAASGGVMGMLGKAGMLGMAGAAGVGAGLLVNQGLDKYSQGTTAEGFQGNAVERMFAKLEVWTDRLDAMWREPAKVKVDINKKELKDVSKSSRGGSYGP